MEMDLDKLGVSHGQQAIPIEVFREIGVDGVLVQALPSISSWVS